MKVNQISKREYFAAHCPESCIHKPDMGELDDFYGNTESDTFLNIRERSLAYECDQRFKYADAMIEALNKKL